MPTTTATMTCRQRLLAFLDGQPTDRVPMWLLFPYHVRGCYVDVRTLPQYRPVFEASRDRAVMLDRRSFSVPIFEPGVQTENRRFTQDGTDIQQRFYRYAGKTLMNERRARGHEINVKPLLDTDEDLETLLSFPVETDKTRIYARLDAQLPNYLAERDDFPIDYGAMMLDLGEPIGFLYGNSNLESYAIWSLTMDPQVVRYLDQLQQRYRLIYQYTLERDLADVYFMVGSELASPPLVNRGTFCRWVVPYARELIQNMRGAGKRVIQHYHGQIGDILPDFLTMGANALHTIEEPPVGNCTLERAFDIVGDQLGLIGCIQYDCFREYTPDRMRQAVRDQLTRLRGQRFMLSPSAGPYEAQPDPRVFANYHAFLDAGWEFGQ
ncbi:MAG: uroporphyrinogen decarboxylase family protein [Phycisphaeraceae bacterium]